MKVEIIIRTHNRDNIHTDRTRYCNIDKTNLIIGCLSSVINSTNAVYDHEISYTILDDHSTPELFDSLRHIFSKSRWPMTLTHLDQSGYNHSGFKQFEACRDSRADLAYCLEDDYLHQPSSIQEMLDSYQLFKEKTGNEIVLYPFDMPDDYVPPWMESCFLVHGTQRHWRTGTWTTFTMMARPQLFKNYWPIFEKLALKYSPTAKEGEEHVHEGNTLVPLWKNHVLRFSPIPSLALHMQFDTQLDPYINWQQWWSDYSKLD